MMWLFWTAQQRSMDRWRDWLYFAGLVAVMMVFIVVPQIFGWV